MIIIILLATRVLTKLYTYYSNGKDDEVSCKSLASLLKTLNLEKYEDESTHPIQNDNANQVNHCCRCGYK